MAGSLKADRRRATGSSFVLVSSDELTLGGGAPRDPFPPGNQVSITTSALKRPQCTPLTFGGLHERDQEQAPSRRPSGERKGSVTLVLCEAQSTLSTRPELLRKLQKRETI